MKQYIESSLREASAALEALLRNSSALAEIERAAGVLVETFERKGRVFACGNGGSMCDAMHFAEELTGRYRHDRGALAATAISDAGHLTCVGNDLGYEQSSRATWRPTAETATVLLRSVRVERARTSFARRQRRVPWE